MLKLFRSLHERTSGRLFRRVKRRAFLISYTRAQMEKTAVIDKHTWSLGKTRGLRTLSNTSLHVYKERTWKMKIKSIVKERLLLPFERKIIDVYYQCFRICSSLLCAIYRYLLLRMIYIEILQSFYVNMGR